MRYQLVYADPPWFYKANPKFGGAATHYPLMTDAELLDFPMRDWMEEKAALFMWATCPRLDFAMRCLDAWDLHYRGVAYVWCKTRKDGELMGARGTPPAFVKPVTELLLVATTIPKGRVFPLMDFKQRQVVLAPTGKHSEKPKIFGEKLTALCGDVSKIELFARTRTPGWDVWGNEVA